MTVALTAGMRVHVLGIGGSGMSALARVMLARGVRVSGSDTAAAERLNDLAALGADVVVGQPTDDVFNGRINLVVRSTAVPDSDPTLQAAVAAGVPVWSRADALVSLAADWQVAAVAGTHGKTTTSSMLAVMLREAGVDCSYVIGSELNATGVNAEQGTSSLAVVEADESDATFLRLDPVYAVVTNIDADHLDRWRSVAALEDAFYEFVAGPARRPRLVVACADDPGSSRLVERLRRENAAAPVMTYGFNSAADVRIRVLAEEPSGVRFSASGELALTEAATGVPGRHNVANAVAAAIVATRAGAGTEPVLAALRGYRGARRRFELRGTASGVRVFDDYAHHPTAVAATLAGARAVADGGRVIALCQPYRWYRTAMFVAEYAVALAAADATVLVDVFGPGEVPISGKGAEAIAARMVDAGMPVWFDDSTHAAVERVAALAREGDIVVTLGGEDIRGAGPRLLDVLGRA